LKLLSFSIQGTEPRLGVLLEDGRVLDVVQAYLTLFETVPPRFFVSLDSLVSAGDRGLKLLRLLYDEAVGELKSNSRLSEALVERAVYSIDRIKFHPPIARPGKMLFTAVNYWSHARELGIEPPESPYFFLKPHTTLVGHRGFVAIPRGSSKPDYEVELAVVIGRRGRYVSRSSAMDHVFGYTIALDMTLRDWQQPLPRLGINWLKAKGFDTSTPMGPWVVTRDEIGDPHSLKLELRVNGEVRQEGSTSDMIFKIPELIEAASEGVTLEPGDIISTGTPSGVGAATGKFLRHGDVVVAVVEKIGALECKVTLEA